MVVCHEWTPFGRQKYASITHKGHLP
jgi:hypothetical protein